MNIILVNADEIGENRVILSGRRADHIVKILGAQVGDTLKLGVVNGRQGLGRIESIQPKHPRAVALQLVFNDECQSSPRIDLVLALPRPIMTRRILSQLTSMGTGHFYLIHARRVEKSFWDAGLLENKQYHEHLHLGLEQAVDTMLPQVSLHPRFKPFIEDVLPAVRSRYSHMLLAHPGNGQQLAAAMQGEAGRVLLIVGPEGGWIDYEIEKFVEQGCQKITLGSRILRVDTAAIALHARISQILEEKSGT